MLILLMLWGLVLARLVCDCFLHGCGVWANVCGGLIFGLFSCCLGFEVVLLFGLTLFRIVCLLWFVVWI